MSIVQNGFRQPQLATPKILSENGEPIPLPPPEMLHGLGLPGGEMHATATEEQAGFMSPEHVKGLNQIARIIVLFTETYAEREHGHPAEPPLPHNHPDIEKKVALVAEKLGLLQGLVLSEFEKRPEVDHTAFALAGHTHPPQPFPPHEHPHTHPEAGEEQAGFMRPRHVKSLSTLETQVAELQKVVSQVVQKIGDIRSILDDHPAPQPARLDHGHLPGGRTHATVTERQAGFMTPEMLSQLKKLWALAASPKSE